MLTDDRQTPTEPSHARLRWTNKNTVKQSIYMYVKSRLFIEMVNVGGVSCARKFWWILDNQGEITLDWQIWFKNKKCHTLLHIMVNNNWKFHWNSAKMWEKLAVQENVDGQTPANPPDQTEDQGNNIICPTGRIKMVVSKENHSISNRPSPPHFKFAWAFISNLLTC